MPFARIEGVRSYAHCDLFWIHILDKENSDVERTQMIITILLGSLRAGDSS